MLRLPNLPKSWRQPALLGLLVTLLLLGLLLVYESSCRAAWGTCGLDGPPRGPVTREFVLGREESHLYYPGSRLLHANSSGQGPDGGLLRPRPAYAQATLETSADSSHILAWYRQQLESRGWQLQRQDSISLQFIRGDRQDFDVYVYGKQAPTGLPYDGQGLVYDIYLQIRAAGP